LILAGGRSRRVGQDKVWLDLHGQPLIERVARRLLPLAAKVIFSAPGPHRFASLCVALATFGVPSQVVSDEYM
jgi:molybdenum cofactor guanylyltransferase